MRAIIPVEIGMAGASGAPAQSLRAVKKASASSALGHQKSDADHGKEKPAPAPQPERLYRDDTPSFDPFWDGPRLVPAFVAQLLGQVMPERRDTAMVETAYGRAVSPRKALLLDRKS
jgi:hypothetical protein